MIIIFLSFSRFVIIVFLVGNFLYLVLHNWKRCKLCTVARLLTVSVLSLIFLNVQGDAADIQKRLLLTKDALTIFFNHPVLGVGLRNYLIFQQQFRVKYLDLLNQPVHNVFLLLLTELGIVGAGIILIFLFKRLKNFVVHYPYVAAVILSTGLFDHYWLMLQQNFLLLGVIAGLALF